MNKEEQRLDSLQAARRFARYWTEAGSRHWSMTKKGDCLFRATLEYQSARGTVRQFASVKLLFGDLDRAGEVSISQEGTLTVQRFVLDFTPDRNTYRFTPRRELVITGHAPKVSGAYNVFLLPLADPVATA